ncbi:MAG: LysR family transcriptional regulator [Gammaproteobacteria bacterium]|nr:LysR family transcriptional regulator [Gammaproteobacteria bacterium]
MSKIEEIEAFVQVVEHQSFTKAAELLEIAKSSLSRRVNELEKRLGVQLLQRTTRKLFLTEQGEQFYQRCLQILSDINEAEDTLRDAQNEIKGRIKIAIPLSFGNKILSKLLSDFIKKHPQIDLQVDLNDRQINLVEDGFDLAIRIGELSDSSLIARKLGSTKLITCASKEYIQLNGLPKTPEELKRHQGLFYTNTSAQSLWQYQVNGTTNHYIPQKILSANNGAFLGRAAINGLGIIHSPDFIVRNALKRGELQVMLSEYEILDIGIYAVFPPGRLIPKRLYALVDFIKQSFQDSANK